jgi:hypothetical protein
LEDRGIAGVAPERRLAPTVSTYLADIVGEVGAPGGPLASLVLFGSAATGGYSASVSDVDLLVVLHDDSDAASHERVRRRIADLEARHSIAKPRPRSCHALGAALTAFADRVTGNVRAFFVCRRADLLSGDPARILGIPRTQALFVDRVAIPSIMASGVTVWGEHLLDAVPLPPIRRADVGKAFLGLFGQTLLTAACYPLLPDATKYAMDALKRSVHNCYFCHHARPAPLAEEVAFLETRDGPSTALTRLLELRCAYRPSYGFVIQCLPALLRLHWRTARLVSFPRAPRDTSDGHQDHTVTIG